VLNIKRVFKLFHRLPFITLHYRQANKDKVHAHHGHLNLSVEGKMMMTKINVLEFT